MTNVLLGALEMRQRVEKEPVNIDLLWQCLLMGGLGSLAGLAALLRSSGKLDRRSFWASLLNSGMFSLAMAAMVFHHFGSEKWLLAIVVSALSGLGGHALIDFALGAIKLALQNKLGGDGDGPK